MFLGIPIQLGIDAPKPAWKVELLEKLLPYLQLFTLSWMSNRARDFILAIIKESKVTLALWKDSKATVLCNSSAQPLSLYQIILAGLRSEDLGPNDRRITEGLHLGEGVTISSLFGCPVGYWIIYRRNEPF